MPVTLSHGWRVGDTLYVGGQISADQRGRSIAADNAILQARNALEALHHVLNDGGQSWANVVSMRVCFKHDGDDVAAEQVLAGVIGMVRHTLPEPRPTLTALAANLVYEGLALEIDAFARAAPKRDLPDPQPTGRRSFGGFPAACISGGELHIGGLVGEAGASLPVQVEATLQRLSALIEGSGFEPSELVKLTLCFVPSGGPHQSAADIARIRKLVARYLPPPRPVVTLLALPGLPFFGQRFQLDGLAVHTSDREAFFCEHA
jgi:enamine deaminase RidA (YjgF/YER057c/UK114 family)